jgi:hypothetical protein
MTIAFLLKNTVIATRNQLLLAAELAATDPSTQEA